MNLYIGLFLLMGLFLGGLTGAAWAMNEHGDHGHEEHANHADHEVFEVPENEPAPSLTLRVMEDPVAGWNLQLVTENFTFAPFHAGINHIPGEGHAHLYINDQKITRILCTWHHIPELAQNNNTIRVVLSTNDHNYYSVNNRIVEDTVEISTQQ